MKSGDKVIASFPEGDELELTVEHVYPNAQTSSLNGKIGHVDIVTFVEKEICSWWYQSECRLK